MKIKDEIRYIPANDNVSPIPDARNKKLAENSKKIAKGILAYMDKEMDEEVEVISVVNALLNIAIQGAAMSGIPQTAFKEIVGQFLSRPWDEWK